MSLIKDDIFPPARPNTTPAPGFACSAPFPSRLGGSILPRADLWADALSSYPDPSFPLLLLRIIRNGASLGVDALPHRVVKKEYRAGHLEMSFLDDEVNRRLAAGEIIQVEDHYPLAICPIAAVPKERTKFRAIHDLRAVNDFVPRSFGTFVYSYLDDFFPDIVLQPNCFLWKIDLSNAFRHIRLSPAASRLAGFAHRGRIYVDLCLPFGSRIAPFTFNLLAEALHWLLLKCGVGSVHHYLDDFFGLAPSFDEARRVMETFYSLASALGISVNPKKCIGPAQVVNILGIDVDSAAVEARLSDERVERYKADISAILDRGTACRSELDSLAGQLNFACTAVIMGRPFMRHIYAAAAALPTAFDRRRLPPAARADLTYWLDLLSSAPARRLLAPQPTALLHVWTDASGLLGAGGHLGAPGSVRSAFVYRFRSKHEGKIILFKEVHAVLHAISAFNIDDSWRGAHVTFHVDNQAACSALDKGTIANDSTLALIRRIWLRAAADGFSFTSHWISSAENGLADALSRFDWERVKVVDPQVPDLFPSFPPQVSAA